jgi:protein SCO1/2
LALTGGLAGAGAAQAHAAAHNSSPQFDQNQALAISQAAVGRPLGNHRWLGTDGKPVSLEQFRGKPLVISLIYTSCYHVCPTMTSHLHRVAKVAWEALGEDSFSVVSIGFDTSVDTPERMRMFARERGIGEKQWRFLSADAQTIGLLTKELGFTYFSSPKGFDHITQTTVVDADGKVYRQVYGQDFEPPSLVEPLKQLVFGERAEGPGVLHKWINNVKLFCTVYDPASGRYRFDYSLFVGIVVGLACLGGVVTFVARAWLQHRDPRATT